MTTTFELILLSVGAGTLLTNLAGVTSSIIGWTSYYPLGQRDWRFHLFWGLTHVMNASLLGLGYLQFRQAGVPGWTLPAGIVLFVGGFAIAIVATFDLGVSQTQGIEEEVRIDGLYRYTRNPQYVGYIPATIGYLFIVGAPFVAPVCALLVIWWLVLPFAEEPWLRDRFGDEYQQYAEQVPRFVGWTTVQRLSEDTAKKSTDRLVL